MTKIAHLTTVHPPSDNRIFHKECKSLARAGYEVVLIAAADDSRTVDGVRIAPLRKQPNRLLRRTRGVWECYRRALQEDAALYHIHDPELLPIACLLRLTGKPVIYDIHEDYITSIGQSRVLPYWLASILSTLNGFIEPLLAAPLVQIIAEKYYARRFPKAIPILNYPDLRTFDVKPSHPGAVREERLLYTGTVGVDRGAFLMAELCNSAPDIQIDIIGKCTATLANEIRQHAGAGSDRISIPWIDSHVPFQEIVAAYRSEKYLAGLAIFPETPHYVHKELTKFFEFMAAGLPVICSDFPVWRHLIVENSVGICVPPNDKQAQIDAISLLVHSPDLAEAMGLNGRKAVEEQFNWQREEEKLLHLYARLLQESATQRR